MSKTVKGGKVPHVKFVAGSVPLTEFSIELDGKPVKLPVCSVDYHLDGESMATATVTFEPHALEGEGRLRLPMEQLVALAEAEGCEIVQKVDSVPLVFSDVTGDQHLAAQRRMADAVERIERHLARAGGPAVPGNVS